MLGIVTYIFNVNLYGLAHISNVYRVLDESSFLAQNQICIGVNGYIQRLRRTLSLSEQHPYSVPNCTILVVRRQRIKSALFKDSDPGCSYSPGYRGKKGEMPYRHHFPRRHPFHN